MGLPANDLEAGLHKVAKYYHMPSWHQPYTIIEIVLNKDVWNGMSETQQAQWEASVRQANVWSMTHSNAIQNSAIKTLTEKKGVEIVKFSPEMLKTMRLEGKTVEVFMEKCVFDVFLVIFTWFLGSEVISRSEISRRVRFSRSQGPEMLKSMSLEGKFGHKKI